jgi:hypothetical protein
MLVTIVVPDNIVSVDGRVLPVDCSSIDGNIRVIQWYDTFGTIEFMNMPGNAYRANGKLTDLGEYQPVIDTWSEIASKIDAAAALQSMTPQMALQALDQIASSPVLEAAPIDQATALLAKIQLDPDLDVPTLGLDECIRLYNIIQGEPKLLAVYPGVAVQVLRKIEADPTLNAMPLPDAVDRVLNPEPPAPAPTLELQANPQSRSLPGR